MNYLASILQQQLATDTATFQYLPTVLSTLEPSHFTPSPHLSKWVARTNSLMHAKDPATKWCGICIAEKTAELCQELLMENAQAWVGFALPILSRSEPPLTQKAAIHLLLRIFSGGSSMAEFQRQVCSPNISKFATSLVTLAERDLDGGLRLVILWTLNSLCLLHPSLLKPCQASVYRFSLRDLAGSYPSRHIGVVVASATLHSSLHLTGGKIGGSQLWRRSLDGAIGTANECLLYIRTAFKEGVNPLQNRLEHPPLPQDGLMGSPIAIDRLLGAITLVAKLLDTVTARTVPLPLGSLVRLTLSLLQLPEIYQNGVHCDALRQIPEESIASFAIGLGCDLLHTISTCAGSQLTAHASQLLNAVSYALHSSKLTSLSRIALLNTIPIVVSNTRPFHSVPLPSRLAKVALPPVIRLLNESSSTGLAEPSGSDQLGDNEGRKRGKKRAKVYEGDEVFKPGKGVCRLTLHESTEALAALDVVSCLLGSGFVSAAVRSTSQRVLLALVLALPEQVGKSISRNASFQPTVFSKVCRIYGALEASGGTGWNSPTLGTIISSIINIPGSIDSKTLWDLTGSLEQILHPRHPPLLRAFPPVETLAIFTSNESKEERDINRDLGLEPRETLGLIGKEAPISVQNGTGHNAPTSITLGEATTSSRPSIAASTLAFGLQRDPELDVATLPQNITPITSFAFFGANAVVAPPETLASVLSSPSIANPTFPTFQPSFILATTNSGSSIVQRQITAPQTLPLDSDHEGNDEDDDEEMPAIDMGSDSGDYL